MRLQSSGALGLALPKEPSLQSTPGESTPGELGLLLCSTTELELPQEVSLRSTPGEGGLLLLHGLAGTPKLAILPKEASR